MDKRVAGVAFVFAFLTPDSALHAAELPRLGVGCPNFSAPDGAAGVLFSRDCKTAYVLPPTVGSFEVRSAAPGGNLALCSAFNITKAGIERRIEDLVTAQVKKSSGLSDTKTKQCLLYYQGKRFQEKSIANFEKQAARIRELIAAKTTELDACKAKTGSDCNLIDLQKVGLALELDNIEHKQDAASTKLASLDAALSTCGNVEEAVAKSKLDTAEGSERAKIFALNDDIFSLYKKYENVEGATLDALIVADHGALVERARVANPTFNIQGVSTAMALAVTSKNPNSTIEFPAALRIAIPSIRAPKELFGEDETKSTTVVFGPSASGNISLSLSATCAATIDKGVGAIEVRPYFDVNAIYRYPVEVGTKIKVSAKFDEIYKRIVKNTSKNGLFHTSSSTEITDFTKTDEVISVEFDTTEDVSIADRERIVAAIKSRVIDRAISLVAREYVPGVGPVTPGAAPQLGATVAAKAIRENCASQWCQVGAVVLDVAAAIFGSSESIASFIKEKNISETESYDLSSVIYQYKTMGFK